MADILEIVKASDCQQRFHILDTLFKSKQQYHFYFYSLVKKMVLRKKQQKMGEQFAIDYIQKNIEKQSSQNILYFKYIRNDDQKAELRIIKHNEASKIIYNRSDYETWKMMPLDKIKGQFMLLKATWTNNYCLCSEFHQINNTRKEPFNLSVPMKETVATICMSISKTATKLLRQQVKNMELVFLKPINQNRLYLLFCQKLFTDEKNFLDITFRQNLEETENLITAVKDHIQTSTCASCCKPNIYGFKEIPYHSIYKLQLKNSTGKRSLSHKRNSITEMYNFAKICPQCFQKYRVLVKNEQKYLQSITPTSVHQVRIKNIPRLSQKVRETFYESQKKIDYRRNHRIYSVMKTNSCTSESTKPNGCDSLLDISYVTKKRNQMDFI